jgi:hypothetical protein
MFPCASGTFIGIDAYSSQPSTKAIYSAGSDARRLEHYFHVAHSKGGWNALTTSDQAPVNRLDVIEAINRWIKGVQRHETGLLYFAGHGALTDQGLVLAASDFVDSLPVDSGIAISRILQLIERNGHRESRYVIMLDCCRQAISSFSPEAVRPNVAVLYACAAGEPAIEMDEGGAYASAVISWLTSEKATQSVGSIEYCSLEGAAHKMREFIASRFGDAVQVPEQFGADPREILIPKSSVKRASFLYDKGAIPRVCLRTSKLDAQQRASVLNRMRLQSFQFCAMSLNNFDDALQICEVTDDSRIEVWLDFVANLFDLSAFFDFVIYRNEELFCEAEIYWNHALADEALGRLASDLALNSVSEGESTRVLFWEAALRTHGRITLHQWNTFGTRARVECRRVGNTGVIYPLISLMPQLSYVFRHVLELGFDKQQRATNFRGGMQDEEGRPDARFLEYCRFAEAAITAGVPPGNLRFRGLSQGFSCAALGTAILEEFRILLCTSDKRYSKVRSSAKKASTSGLSAITAYVAGKFGMEAAAVAASVAAISVVVQRVGVSALCSALGPSKKTNGVAKQA